MDWTVRASPSSYPHGTWGNEIESLARHLFRSSFRVYQFQGFCATLSISEHEFHDVRSIMIIILKLNCAVCLAVCVCALKCRKRETKARQKKWGKNALTPFYFRKMMRWNHSVWECVLFFNYDKLVGCEQTDFSFSPNPLGSWIWYLRMLLRTWNAIYKTCTMTRESM